MISCFWDILRAEMSWWSGENHRADGIGFSNIFTIFVHQETKWETDYEQVYQYIG